MKRIGIKTLICLLFLVCPFYALPIETFNSYDTMADVFTYYNASGVVTGFTLETPTNLNKRVISVNSGVIINFGGLIGKTADYNITDRTSLNISFDLYNMSFSNLAEGVSLKMNFIFLADVVNDRGYILQIGQKFPTTTKHLTYDLLRVPYNLTNNNTVLPIGRNSSNIIGSYDSTDVFQTNATALNTFSLIITADTISIYHNGSFRFTVYDSTFKNGTVGFGFEKYYTSGAIIKYQIDEIEINEPINTTSPYIVSDSWEVVAFPSARSNWIGMSESTGLNLTNCGLYYLRYTPYYMSYIPCRDHYYSVYPYQATLRPEFVLKYNGEYWNALSDNLNKLGIAVFPFASESDVCYMGSSETTLTTPIKDSVSMGGSFKSFYLYLNGSDTVSYNPITYWSYYFSCAKPQNITFRVFFTLNSTPYTFDPDFYKDVVIPIGYPFNTTGVDYTTTISGILNDTNQYKFIPDDRVGIEDFGGASYDDDPELIVNMFLQPSVIVFLVMLALAGMLGAVGGMLMGGIGVVSGMLLMVMLGLLPAWIGFTIIAIAGLGLAFFVKSGISGG